MLRTLLLALWGLLTLSMAMLQTAAAERPNIILIQTDDQGAWALTGEHPNARTPNLDRLAASGAKLLNCYTATPVCSPSRASLIASRYGSEVGITDWIKPDVEIELGLDPALVTWPEILAEGGYHNALCGKWHLGLPDRFHPRQFGYQHFMGIRGGGASPKNPELEVQGKTGKVEGFMVELIVDDAIEFVRREQAHPFHLSLHFREPHAAYLPVPDGVYAPFEKVEVKLPNPDYPKLDVAGTEKRTREYLASVAALDLNVGRLLDELDTLKLTDKTIVIFISDHGYNMGHHGIWHKGNGHWMLTENPPGTANVPKGQRPNMFDTSLRVPGLVRWPGVVKPGTQIQETVMNLDWYPTIVEMAGLAIPKTTLIRGKSIVPLLRGEQVAWDNDAYFEYSTHHQSKTHMRAYRTPEWKLIRDFLNPERSECYHLAVDPGETKNLIDSTDPAVREMIAKLDEKIRERMAAIGDKTATGK